MCGKGAQGGDRMRHLQSFARRGLLFGYTVVPMSLLEQMLEHNKAFVESGTYERFRTDRFPDKKLAILACMDARLLELLPNALGLKNGDVKMIKNAGALILHPWGSVMRSLVVAVYELRVSEICVIAHRDCGMSAIDPERVLQEAHKRGISLRTMNTLRVAGIDLDNWLRGFDNVDDSVRKTVEFIRTHPLMPKDVPAHGLVMDPLTGEVSVLVDGYKALSKRTAKALLKAGEPALLEASNAEAE